MFHRKTILGILAIATLLLAVSGTASAHKTAYSPDGKVKIVWGFVNEPAVSMTKNGLHLALSDNLTGAPITGAESLHAELKYAGADEERELPLSAQFNVPGAYTSVVTPSKPGLYTLHLKGTINGSEVDLEIPASHDVTAIEETYFPEIEAAETGDTAELVAQIQALTARVSALEAKAQTQSNTPATLTPQPTAGGNDTPLSAGIVLAALGAVALALAMRRRT